MGLPAVACPACNAKIPMEAWLGHAGAREALIALARLHPSQERLALTALRYAALFAPARQTMRLDRLAAVLGELGELIASGRVEWEHASHAAPLPLWIAGMEEMIGRRDIRPPLSNHNYLRAVVAGMAAAAAARAEARAEEIKRSGARLPDAQAAEPPFAAGCAAGEAPAAPAGGQRGVMPDHVAAQLRGFLARKTL